MNDFCNVYATHLGGVWYGFVPFLICTENLPLKYTIPEKICICHAVLLLFWHFLFWPCKIIICLLVIFSIKWQISVWICVCFGLILFRLLIYLSFLWSFSLVSQLLLSNSNLSESSISNNAGPFVGPAMKLHQDPMPLWFGVMYQLPIYGLYKVLWVYKTTFSLHLFTSTIVVFVKRTWTFGLALDCYQCQYWTLY